MTAKTGELRRLASELNNLADEMDRTPVPDGAPVLYEDVHVTIYGTPESYGGEDLYLQHTGGRSDMGVVMVSEANTLHNVISSFVEERGE